MKTIVTTFTNIWRHRAFLFGRTMMSLSVWWLLFEIFRSDAQVKSVLDDFAPLHILVLFLCAFVSGLVLLARAITNVHFTLRDTKLEVSIIFGDLFEQAGSLFIPVSTAFRTRRGLKSVARRVSPTSVHGQLISKSGGEDVFQAALTKALAHPENTDATPPAPKNAEFDSQLGKVVTLRELKTGEHGERVVHLVAVTEDDEDGKTATNLARLFVALPKALADIRTRDGSSQLLMPLIGSGFGRIKLAEENLLDVILAGLAEDYRENREQGKITIVLNEPLRGRIKLYNVRREWS